MAGRGDAEEEAVGRRTVTLEESQPDAWGRKRGRWEGGREREREREGEKE